MQSTYEYVSCFRVNCDCDRWAFAVFLEHCNERTHLRNTNSLAYYFRHIFQENCHLPLSGKKQTFRSHSDVMGNEWYCYQETWKPQELLHKCAINMSGLCNINYIKTQVHARAGSVKNNILSPRQEYEIHFRDEDIIRPSGIGDHHSGMSCLFSIQGWAKKWSLGCVNLRLAARGSQEAT